MASINEILGRNIDSVKELKKAIGELQNSLIGLDSESQEFKDTSMKLAAAQDELTKVTKAGKEENVAATDSIVGMEQEYKKLYNTYKMLSDEQRNSDFGKNMAESLETLSTKLNETKQGVGNFKDNIGRYAGSVTEAFNKMGVSAGALQGPLKTATTGAKGFNTALKSLAANPVVLILATLVAILGKAADAIKNNEELTNRLKEAMAVFKPVLDAVSNAFDFLAGILVKTVEGLTKVASKIMSVIPGMKDAIKSHQDLAKATNDLTKAQRENSVVASEKQAEIERLREEASATDDVVEKKRLLEEAKKMQQEVDQKEIELAQEELRIMQEYADKTANSAEENEKLAAAQKKVNDAIAQGERNMRMYNKQLDATEKSTSSAGSATKNYREEAKKLYEQVVENSKTEIQKLTEKYEKEKKLLIKYGYNTNLLTAQYEKESSKIRYDAWKKQEDERNRMLDNEIELRSRRWKNQQRKLLDDESGLADAMVDFFTSALTALDEFDVRLGEEVANVDKAYGDLFSILFQASDLTKISDYDYVAEIVKSFSIAGESKENIEAVKNLFASFGKEGWAALVGEIQYLAKDLIGEFGLDLKNAGDIEALGEELGYKMKEAIGNVFLTKIDTKQLRANLLAGILDAYKDIENDPTIKSIKLTSFFQGVFGTQGVETEIFSESVWKNIQEHILAYEAEMLEAQKAYYEANLDTFTGTTEQRLQYLEQYYAVVEELELRHQELSELNQQRTLEMVQNLGDATDSLGSSLNTIKSSYETLTDSQLKAGKIDEQTAKKRKKTMRDLEIATQAFSIATIAADAASGLFSIWKGYATEVGTINAQTAAAAGPAAAAVKTGLDAKSLVSAIAKTTSLAATATAQIMAARNGIVSAQNNMSAESGGGADAGVGVTPVLIDSTPYSYTRTVQTEEDVDELNQRPIFVTVTDILDGIDNRKVQVTETSF